MTQPKHHARYTALIDTLPATVPFVGPEAQERTNGRAFAARLGANENGFGPSPRAIAAMQAAAAEAWKYADPEGHDLRHALAAHHQIAAQNIVLGEGIDGLLGYLVRLLIAPGDGVVTSLGGYPTLAYHAAGFGAQIHQVPYHNDREDLHQLMATAAQTGAKLIYFANPDNPMGSWHSADTIQHALQSLPAGCLLLLDEAYLETAPEGTAPPLDTDDPRVIRMRTFSKAYGLAGARVGYAIGRADLIANFEKIRNHFGMGRIGLAGAQAALEDQTHLRRVLTQIQRARERIALIARQNGLAALPSATNFVTLDCGQDGAFAHRVLDQLVAQGIFVRKPFVAPQDRCIRVSCGPDAELDAFAQALPSAIAAAQTSA